MSSHLTIKETTKAAPTPVNTPLTTGVLSGGLSRPTVPDIEEDDEAPLGKLAALIGKSSGYVESLPVPVRRNVEALKGVQTQYLEIHKQLKKEMLELEAKYIELYKPIFARRAAIIAGAAAATEEEIKAGEAESLKDDPEFKPLPRDPAAPNDPKGIPEFWLTALRNHVGLGDLITDRDAPALAHLTDVTLENITAPSPGFKITFHFSPNEYFDNVSLDKTYLYRPEIGYAGDYVYEKAIGTTIRWKDAEKDLTKSFEIKKQRNKNTNRTRLVRKAHSVDSFFNFFDPPVPPAEDAVERGDIDDDELEELEERLEIDYQIGEDLKERIIPRAVDYFTGKALEYDDADDDDFEDLDDEDEDDEDDDDE